MTQSHNRNPRQKYLHAPLCGALAIFTLSSCAAPQAVRTGMLPPAPYYAMADNLLDDSSVTETGYFEEKNGCIVFRTTDSGPAMTPVFPKGETALATDGVQWLGLFVKGDPVAMRTPYRLHRTELSSGASLTKPVPSGCPQRYIGVTSVGKTILANQPIRLCYDAMLCTGFRLD